MDVVSNFFARSGYLPHGYCFTWSPGVLWAMVASDAAIAVAYFSIPLAIVSFVRRRPEAAFDSVPWLFSAFIFACGLTHVMDVWTVWQPDYPLQALSKGVTAVVSIITAVTLWRLLPQALKIPSAQQLQAAVNALELEVRKRRSAEETLLDIQQNLAATLSSIGAGFIATDREGRVTRMNAEAEQMLGWTQAEVIEQPVTQVLVPEQRDAPATPVNPVQSMIERGIEVDTQKDIVVASRHGGRALLEVTTALVRAGDGSVRGVALVLRDVSRLRRAEVESNRLAAIVNSSNDAIIGKTLEGRITSWNGAAEALFGYTAAEAIGHPIQMLIPPDRADEEMRVLSDLAHGSPVPAFETVRRAKDGSLLDVSVSISPIRDERGRVVGGSKIARDISGQRRAEAARLKAERLEAENRQILEASRLKSRFLANMSHELRTPLNAIIGFSDVLKGGSVPADSPLQQKFLGNIATSGRHLLQLINDVLDLSKVESGRFEFYPEPIVLDKLVREVCDVLHTALIRQQISLQIDLEAGLDDLVLDPARLKQVLFNYLSNAIKFSNAGGRVSIRARSQGETHFRIEVEDHGVGIAEDDVPRLFNEFQQLDAGFSKRHQGTGLGLALSRRLILAQGGSVGVRSVLGQGSVFHFVLQRWHGTDAPIDTHSPPDAV